VYTNLSTLLLRRACCYIFLGLMKGSFDVPILNVDVKKMMKPVITAINEKYKLKLKKIRTTSLELRAMVHTTNENKMEEQDAIDQLNEKIQKYEDTIAREKETMELNVTKITQETESCEQLIYKLRHEPSPNMSSLRNELREVKAQ
jgi:SMC interacting uncharacterized protein involved in chromosome segregation